MALVQYSDSDEEPQDIIESIIIKSDPVMIKEDIIEITLKIKKPCPTELTVTQISTI